MDVTLTSEQRQAKEAVRGFLDDLGGSSLARRMVDGDDGVVDEVWSSVRDRDYVAVGVSDGYGGLLTSMMYRSVVLEEFGRVALPGPFPETMVFAGPLIEALGSESQKEALLPKIASGAKRVSVGLYDRREDRVADAIGMQADAVNDGFVLSGTKTHVPYAGMVDAFIIVARSGDTTGYAGLSVFVVDADLVVRRRVDSLDSTRPLYEVEFDDVLVDDDALLGSVGESGKVVRRALDQYRTGIAAMQVGGADRVVELSANYGNEREQYGHPIGRFQAVKHRIADMRMDVERARSLVYYAAWVIEVGDPDAARAVSAAKAFTSDTFLRVFGDGIKNDGGLGFTVDHDGHVFLKQAVAWRNYLGSPAVHRERIADERGF
jgi:alkylation response protein AidB-like acyl-CoA dehydrogenase